MKNNTLFTKLTKAKAFVTEKELPFLTGVTTYAVMTAGTMVHADAATDLMDWIIKGLSILLIVPAVIMAIMGLAAYASAHAEGDGPAMGKARGQIAAGVMLVVLSIVLNASAGRLAAMISTSI